jgi:ferric-dicitrate binding protein FerR (iron transport regulator)
MANERFIELLTKKLSDEIDAGELEEFKYFLANDDTCRQQYNFFKSYWVQDEEHYSNTDFMFQRIKKKIGIREPQTEIIIETEEPGKIFTFWRSIAAIFLAGICISFSYYFLNHTSKVTRVANLELVKTPTRIKSRIILSDGSIITLNAETTLKYPPAFTGQTREVYLDGEAFFDVAKDHKHPFIVHAGKMSIKVLGTAFNVKSYSNDASSETTLIRGAIEVTLADRPSDRIILKPSDKLILKSSTFKIYNSSKHLAAITPDSVNTNYALTNLTYLKSNDTTIVETSWVNNKLVFKDEVFNELANQMERWYGVKIKFKNGSVKDYRFTGVFEKESLTQALDALKMIETFNYKYKNETIYIY